MLLPHLSMCAEVPPHLQRVHHPPSRHGVLQDQGRELPPAPDSTSQTELRAALQLYSFSLDILGESPWGDRSIPAVVSQPGRGWQGC